MKYKDKEKKFFICHITFEQNIFPFRENVIKWNVKIASPLFQNRYRISIGELDRHISASLAVAAMKSTAESPVAAESIELTSVRTIAQVHQDSDQSVAPPPPSAPPLTSESGGEKSPPEEAYKAPAEEKKTKAPAGDNPPVRSLQDQILTGRAMLRRVNEIFPDPDQSKDPAGDESDEWKD